MMSAFPNVYFVFLSGAPPFFFSKGRAEDNLSSLSRASKECAFSSFNYLVFAFSDFESLASQFLKG